MRRFVFAISALVIMSCSGEVSQNFGCGCPIYPDYMDVTVPAGIAPLNFDYCIPADDAVTVFSYGDLTYRFKGPEIRWNAENWRRLLSAATDNDIQVTSSVIDRSWTIHVSGDDIDYGLNYRLLEPGYEVYSKMGIYERDLSSFRQRTLIDNNDFSGCVNCHAYNRADPSGMTLHIRGDHGATLLMKEGRIEAYDTKTDSTSGFCVYPYWHPSGKYIAYSTNNTRQSYHTKAEKLIEVFDLASDVQVYDVEHNCLILNPSVRQKGMWETFPVFSADGRTLFFCAASEKNIDTELESVRYNLYKVSFDPESGTIGDDVELVIDAESDGKSISFPRPSYDGRFLVYTLSDYGQFSIWHHEADLWKLDLLSGETSPAVEVNSGDTESFHNFSSNSRWMVFSSRRDDGQFTRLYIAHVDENGCFSKAFMLPQKNPRRYYGTLFMSYNVPEFVSGPVSFSHTKAARAINGDARIPFGVKHE